MAAANISQSPQKKARREDTGCEYVSVPMLQEALATHVINDWEHTFYTNIHCYPVQIHSPNVLAIKHRIEAQIGAAANISQSLQQKARREDLGCEYVSVPMLHEALATHVINDWEHTFYTKICGYPVQTHSQKVLAIKHRIEAHIGFRAEAHANMSDRCERSRTPPPLRRGCRAETPERAPRKRRVEELFSPVQEKRLMRELPVMPNHKLACNLVVFANEKGHDDAELDSWIRLSDVRPGAMGLATNIKALLEGFVELPDFLHVINQRHFLEKGLPPSLENLQRMVGYASALKPGSVAIWTGKYTARLFQSCFQHGHPEFHSNQPILVMQDMLDAEAASMLALSELQRQMYVWPLDKFKVIICLGVLHIGTVGHLARDDNPVLPHIQLAMPNIVSRFQHFQRSMKMHKKSRGRISSI